MGWPYQAARPTANTIVMDNYSHVTRPTHAQIERMAQRVLRNVEFDTMVTRGLSGAVVVPEMARSMNKRWMVIRKPGENTHDDHPALGVLGRRWIFVDDFIASGKTLYATQQAVEHITDRENTRRRDTYEAQSREWHDYQGKFPDIKNSVFYNRYPPHKPGRFRAFRTTFVGTYEYNYDRFNPEY